MPCGATIIGDQPGKYSFPWLVGLPGGGLDRFTTSDCERYHGACEKNGAP